MDIQAQLRHNVEDMHKALHDLESWTSEIGSRDKALRGMEDEADARKGDSDLVSSCLKEAEDPRVRVPG